MYYSSENCINIQTNFLCRLYILYKNTFLAVCLCVPSAFLNDWTDFDEFCCVCLSGSRDDLNSRLNLVVPNWGGTQTGILRFTMEIFVDKWLLLVLILIISWRSGTSMYLTTECPRVRTMITVYTIFCIVFFLIFTFLFFFLYIRLYECLVFFYSSDFRTARLG